MTVTQALGPLMLDVEGPRLTADAREGLLHPRVGASVQAQFRIVALQN
jgi:hypothetical protein